VTDIERQILLNHIAIMEALAPVTAAGANSTRELLLQRYHQTAELLRQHSPNPQR
jgi:hypothetical protein